MTLVRAFISTVSPVHTHGLVRSTGEPEAPPELPLPLPLPLPPELLPPPPELLPPPPLLLPPRPAMACSTTRCTWYVLCQGWILTMMSMFTLRTAKRAELHKTGWKRRRSRTSRRSTIMKTDGGRTGRLRLRCSLTTKLRPRYTDEWTWARSTRAKS